MNASIVDIAFKLYYYYNICVLFKNEINLCFKSCYAYKLAKKLKDLMLICQQNLLYAQKTQNQAYNNSVKPWSYAPGEIVCLNPKYIKTKQNLKFEIKFFDFFGIIYFVGKPIY